MYWIIAAAILLVIEMFIGTFYLLIVCASFVCAGLAQWLFNSPIEINILLACFFSIVGIAYVRKWQKKHRQQLNHKNESNDPDFNQIVILDHINNDGTWTVQYRGTQWQALDEKHHHHFKQGDRAYIIGKKGNILLLKLHESTLKGN